MDGTGATTAGAASVERIVATATRLFAAHGFAGTRVRDIAAGAGLNVATVAFHVGSKEDLYKLVFRRLRQRETEALGRVFAETMSRLDEGATDLVSVIVDLAGAFVDWFADEPYAGALWARRWLDDDFPADEQAREYNLDFYAVAGKILATAADAGEVRAGDHHLALKGFIWMTYGRQIEGLLETPAQRARYRAFTAEYVRGLLEPSAS